MKTVLLIGSAPDAVLAKKISLSDLTDIVVINNAWRVRDDWTHLVCPEDFPEERRPVAGKDQEIITHEKFVPANNAFGGIVYAGATMAFTAGYWVLHALKPDVLAFIGCDMVYDDRQTHFYGKGEADPLRDDPTLQNLQAKSNRMLWFAARQGCLCVNLSESVRSELTFPRLSLDAVGEDVSELRRTNLNVVASEAANSRAEQALELESQADCFVESGDYWNHPDNWNAEALTQIDQLWLKVF